MIVCFDMMSTYLSSLWMYLIGKMLDYYGLYDIRSKIGVICWLYGHQGETLMTS